MKITLDIKHDNNGIRSYYFCHANEINIIQSRVYNKNHYEEKLIFTFKEPITIKSGTFRQ